MAYCPQRQSRVRLLKRRPLFTTSHTVSALSMSRGGGGNDDDNDGGGGWSEDDELFASSEGDPPRDDDIDADDDIDVDGSDDNIQESGEGCTSEEECEIDWDNMPGLEDDDTAEQDTLTSSLGTSTSTSTITTSTTSSNTSNTSNSSKSLSSDSSAAVEIEKSRWRLEMMWQLTEAAQDCLVAADQPNNTCGRQPCTKCHGRGTLPCRFCGGTLVLGFQPPQPPLPQHDDDDDERNNVVQEQAASTLTTSMFYACPICNKGVEACGACRGTGWVADWALLSPRTSMSTLSSTTSTKLQ